VSDLSPAEKRLPGDKAAYITPEQARTSRLLRRREKIVAEIQRNRRGDYIIPTWALTTLLAALVVGFATLIIFVGG
jgi:hypothetical protein